MMYRAIDCKFGENTTIIATFETGEVKKFDIASMFNKYPQLEALTDRVLFTSGKIYPFLIVWNEDLDIGMDTIYYEGETIDKIYVVNMVASNAVRAARVKAHISQKELSLRTGIDQSDISKIERGVANPTVDTLDRIAKALNGSLNISIDINENEYS